jgi:hypothetical protein
LIAADYITHDGNFVAPACIEYLKPLVGPLPEYVRLENMPAK